MSSSGKAEPGHHLAQFIGFVAVVLGSGLGSFTESLEERFEIAYTDIPHWPAAAVSVPSGSADGRSTATRILPPWAGRGSVTRPRGG